MKTKLLNVSLLCVLLVDLIMLTVCLNHVKDWFTDWPCCRFQFSQAVRQNWLTMLTDWLTDGWTDEPACLTYGLQVHQILFIHQSVRQVSQAGTYLSDWLTDWLTDGWTDVPFCQTDWWMNRWTQMSNWLTDAWTDEPDWLTDRLTDRWMISFITLSDWLTNGWIDEPNWLTSWSNNIWTCLPDCLTEWLTEWYTFDW